MLTFGEALESLLVTFADTVPLEEMIDQLHEAADALETVEEEEYTN
jgi:hypothetical protein